MATTGPRSGDVSSVGQSFTDQRDREIRIERYDAGPDPLEAFYEHFDDESRAQGIPPRSAPRRSAWIEDLLEGYNVAAWQDDPAESADGDRQVVGHAVLIPYGDAESELAIFVRPDYQCAGIGTELVRSLLAFGRSVGIERVTLVVEPANTIAVSLYRTVGFSVTDKHRGEFQMAREL